MPIVLEVVVHSQTTRRRGLSYQFTPKHHGGAGSKGQAQWLIAISFEQEFSIFDTADEHELSEDDSRLYGILKTAEGEVQFLGTWDEQVAVFPSARAGEAWHGYPVYPLANDEAAGRGGDAGKPPKSVFQKMVQNGLLSITESKRLMKGRHI